MTTPSPIATRRIAAAPDVVADAIASPYGLGVWLCDDARAEGRAGGVVTLNESGGARWQGHWTAFDKPSRLGWLVRDADGHSASADITLTPDGDGTRVDVAYDGDDVDAATPAAWQARLGDLDEFVRTGRNARLLRRPMLGVAPDFSAFEAQDGAHIAGAVPGGGAEKAGLKTGDVITSIGGAAVARWDGIAPTLAGRSAGDTLPVTIVRDGAARTVAVTLGGRPEANVPTGDVATVADLRHVMDTLVGELRETLDGIGDAEADFRPGPEEWNVREVIGHLIFSERHSQLSMMLRATDEPPAAWPGGPESALQGILGQRPLPALRDALVDDLGASLALAEKIFNADATPPVRRYLVESLAFTGEHVRDHIGQIKANVEGALRQGVNG